MSDPEPRWPAMVAMLGLGGLRLALPSELTIGPDWLMVPLIAALAAILSGLHRRGQHAWNMRLSYVLSSLVTADMISSLTLLIWRLPRHLDPPRTLLIAAAGLWVSNILVFASWYWRLDGGGPHARDQRQHHEEGAFLFPQMTIPPDQRRRHWRPGFVDYLFLAFNTSTAFSPTDVPVLSRWAKLLMMVQSCLSLGTVAIVAARAINVL